MKQKKLQKKRLSRANRVHYNARLRADGKMRVTVFKSLNHIYAQLINDATHTTVCAASTLTMQEKKGDKSACAKLVGQELAKKAQDAGVTEACFDRGRFLYHGRVKALAEGLRDGGLKI